MITINLTPEEELENPLWFAPDVGVLLLAALIAFFLVNFHFSQIEAEISVAQADVERSENGYRLLRDDVTREQSLLRNISELNSRLQALSRITSSRLVRYRPVIILEHLQNLRPEGVWFDEVTLLRERGPVQNTVAPPENDEENEDEGNNNEEEQNQINQQVQVDQDFNSIRIRGKALDNILVAEFISALKATQTQDVDSSDLRTQVYFSQLKLHNTRATEFNLEQNADGEGNARESSTVVEFEIQFTFREHATGARRSGQQRDFFSSINLDLNAKEQITF